MSLLVILALSPFAPIVALGLVVLIGLPFATGRRRQVTPASVTCIRCRRDAVDECACAA